MDEYSQKYKSELLDSIKRTVNEKYFVPYDAINALGTRNNIFNKESDEELYLLFSRFFSEPDGTFDLSKVKGQCIMCHSKMKEVISEYLGIKPLITIGYVTFEGIDRFRFASMNKDLLRNRENSGEKVADIHVWLTLPSLEIIDFTFLAHYAFVNSSDYRKNELKKATDFIFNFGNADSLEATNKIIYHPVYVGSDILRKNNFIG